MPGLCDSIHNLIVERRSILIISWWMVRPLSPSSPSHSATFPSFAKRMIVEAGRVGSWLTGWMTWDYSNNLPSYFLACVPARAYRGNWHMKHNKTPNQFSPMHVAPGFKVQCHPRAIESSLQSFFSFFSSLVPAVILSLLLFGPRKSLHLLQAFLSCALCELRLLFRGDRCNVGCCASASLYRVSAELV